jgi:hypothetical protein
VLQAGQVYALEPQTLEEAIGGPEPTARQRPAEL